ncbi:hypothetical protein ADL28_42835 [Streptomyces violaceusniger]|uniref:DUF4440 domain-containing protein n=2 Tax=Streptomyces violaceusniger group TaxID=2839105 RepID=A0ABD5JJB4_9ACTN|nr:hypothetical protein [Streptomyces violaceusniger]KUL43407.1 hypothetical protein ADL28_42835 [Streptomyces violaceusniger]MEE4588145.1 hypothetical protein [Streptomyces sp. DSM 41602]
MSAGRFEIQYLTGSVSPSGHWAISQVSGSSRHHAEGFRTSLEIDHITFPAADVAVVSTRQHWATPQDSGANAGTWILTRKDGAWWVCTVQNTRITTA